MFFGRPAKGEKKGQNQCVISACGYYTSSARSCNYRTVTSTQYSLSPHHLKKQVSLTKFVCFFLETAFKAVFYSLADEHVRSIIGQGMEHVEE